MEGLALRIIQKKVSRILFDKRVVALDMTAVVAVPSTADNLRNAFVPS